MAALSCAILVACAAEPPIQRHTDTVETASPRTTSPATAEELRFTEAARYVDSLSTRERVASVIMSNVAGTDPQALLEFASGNSLGGFLLMGNNIPETPEALRVLTDAIAGEDPHLPRLLAIDEEGGEVTRLPWDVSLGANELRFLPSEVTRTAFTDRAALLNAAGITVNFGIVADFTDDTESFIYWRTLGDTPAAAAERTRAAVMGERTTVLSTLKHFPGHGAAAGDSHTSIPQTMQDFASWQVSDRLPFQAGVDAGAELLMFGHLSYVQIDPLPASLSAEWHRIAREDLGFTGVAISDDLGMLLNAGLPQYSNISVVTAQALAAGADMALLMEGVDPATLPTVIDEITATVDAGGPTHDRLREAAIRVAELRLLLGERADSSATR